ncbi:ATP-binding protein [Streptomyces sp. CoH27]|uniref:ATP-binding protein n=1 Tax=Streptomyces sp. CoH27 TaxID=2875763 RepID=UPI0027E1553F|nr:ATP-binding protein [Streptomyces sp. CoH27]
MEAHQLALSLPSTPAAASEARHQAVVAIAGWDTELDAEVVHTAALLVSELVTNAVQYAGTGSASLTVCLDEAVLRVEVCDASPVLPQPALPDVDSEGGRGLTSSPLSLTGTAPSRRRTASAAGPRSI